MIQRLKTYFFLKKSGAYTSGPVPVYLRVTINGKRAEASVQRTFEPAKWDQRKGRAMGIKGDAMDLNNYLDIIQGDVFMLQKQYALQAATPTPIQFIKKLFHQELNANPRLLEVFRSHNLQFEKTYSKEFSPGTLKKFNTALRHLKDFITWKYNANDVDLHLINNLFIKEYDFYLKSVAALQHNTVMSNIKKPQKIIRQCMAN